METIRSDEYEEMASTFQVMLIHWLQDAFKDAGVKDQKIIRQVSENFFASSGTFIDQYWFKDGEGNKVYPCIAFSAKGPPIDTELAEHEKVFFPSNCYSWNEYSKGNVEYYFDECNMDVSKIEYSDEGGEIQPVD